MSTAIPYSQFVGDRDPYEILASTPRRLAELTANLPGEQLSAPIAPGKWSIHQIIAHLADGELVANFRFRMLLFEEAPLLAAYDQDRWMAGWMRENEPLPATLERFRLLRESTLRALRHAPVSDRKRSGTHAERGPVTAEDYAITLAGHDLNHLVQLERLGAAGG